MDDSGQSCEKALCVEGHGCVFRGQVVFGYPPKPRRRCNSGCPQNRGNSTTSQAVMRTDSARLHHELDFLWAKRGCSHIDI